MRVGFSMLLALTSEDVGPYVLALGVMLVTAALLIGIRKKRAKRHKQPSGREQLERNRQQSAMRGELDQTMVELEQLAKRLGSQLDAKTLTIEKRLAEADQRIDELKRLQEGSGDDMDKPPPRATPNADRSVNTSKDAETAAITNQRTATDTSAGAPGAEPEPTDETTRWIYQYADEGLAASQIAHRVGEHVGKVELILALRNT